MSYAQITSSTDSLLVAGKSTDRRAANFWLAGVDIGGVCVGHGSLVAPNAVIYCAHNAIGIGGTVRFATGEVRKIVAMERVEIAATASPDDMFLAKLDSPVTASPLPIVASWGGQTLNDLPVCFDRLDDNVFVQEVRNSSLTSQLQNLGAKICRFCERASQAKRVPFTAPAQRWVGDATSSNSCFVIHNGKAYFVGPAAYAWGASSQPWPNVAYIDLTQYVDALKAAASKLGVALRFASFTTAGVTVDPLPVAPVPTPTSRDFTAKDIALDGTHDIAYPDTTTRRVADNGTDGCFFAVFTAADDATRKFAFRIDGRVGTLSLETNLNGNATANINGARVGLPAVQGRRVLAAARRVGNSITFMLGNSIISAPATGAANFGLTWGCCVVGSGANVGTYFKGTIHELVTTPDVSRWDSEIARLRAAWGV
jgi:hypothetical protein